MKHMTLALLSLLSLNAFASQDIYQALNTEELSLSSTLSNKKFKSVGGLTCTKESSYTEGKKFECEFDFNRIDSAKIYKALVAVERSLAAPRTELRYEKKAGGLSCLKVNSIQSRNSFSCKFTTVSTKRNAEPRE